MIGPQRATPSSTGKIMAETRQTMQELRAVAEENKDPGSNSALDEGCTCAVLDNAHGIGYRCNPGKHVITLDCPLHGHGGIDDRTR